MKKQKHNATRWWLLAAVLSAAVFAFLLIWQWDAPNRQRQVTYTLITVGVFIVSVVLWLQFFSGMHSRQRRIGFGVLAALLLAAASLFRISGFSGDLVPVIEWRWGDTAGEPSVGDAPAVSDQRIQSTAISNDFPQFLGPHRDATLSGIQLQTDWQQFPPREIWRQPVGQGWSAFAIKGELAVTLEQRDDHEMVVCYYLGSGKLLWQHADKTRYASTVTGDGPRSTPTISGNRVFSAGATGMLNCLDIRTGQKIWSVNYLEDNGAKIKEWGNSGSPLVVDSLVIINAGGDGGRSLVAYHRDSGRKLWSAGDDPAGHSSPLLATIAGVPQIIVFNHGSIIGHDPANGGRVLWRQDWPVNTQAVAQPLVLPGDRLFVSSGYGIGSKLFQLTNTDGVFTVTEIWKSPRMKAKFTNVVHRDGYIYGLDDGVLACIDAATGQRRWKSGRYGHGQLILIGDILLIQGEKGNIALVAANPDSHKELAAFPALNGKTWNNPAFSNPFLLLRNDREAVCFELAIQ